MTATDTNPKEVYEEKPAISAADSSDLKTTEPAGQYVDAESQQEQAGSVDRDDKKNAPRYSWDWIYAHFRPYIHAAIFALMTVFVFPSFLWDGALKS